MRIVNVINLRKTFNKELVLKDVSLSCDSSEVAVLLGPNGSGKTTTLRIIAGVVKRSSGKVEVLGRDPWDTFARKNLSYLPQRIEFPGSYKAKDILNLIARIRGVSISRINYIVDRFSIGEWIEKYVGELSRGMLQRLALAATFLPEVPLYLLDEPSNNLDFEGLIAFRSEASEVLKRGSAIVLSTHSLVEAEMLSTRVFLIWKGEVIKEEDSRSFFNVINHKRRLWIRLGKVEDRFVELLEKECNDVERKMDVFKVSVPPDKRFYLLNLLYSQGAEIKEFGLEEPDLEEIYSMFF